MTGRLEPPDRYDDERRATWHETINRLRRGGDVFRADPHLIDAYVEAVAAHTQACRIRAQTAVLITRGDRAVENPALAVQRRAAADMANAARRLGLHRDQFTVSDPAPPPDRTGGARWCARHGRLECVHHKRRCGCPSRDVSPPPAGCCHQPAIEGTKACYHHAGKTLAAAREQGQVTLARVYGGPARDIDPVRGLLEEVRRSAGVVAGLETLVAELEAQAAGGAGSGPLWAGTVREVVRDDGSVERERRPGMHVILRAYNEERDRFVRACLAAKTAGAQQEAVDAARALGAGVGRLLDAVFAALLLVPPDLEHRAGAGELVAWQRAQLPVVVPAVLREFEPPPQVAS